MLFHIGSTGRSGSVYVHRMLTQMGIGALHEKASERPFRDMPLSLVEERPDVFQFYKGTVGWQWEVACPNLVAAAEHKFFMVRDPVDFLKSAVTHSDKLYDTVEAEIGTRFVRPGLAEDESKLTRAANLWLGYLDRFGKGRPLLKVEEFCHGGASLALFCDIVGLPQAITMLAVDRPRPINTRADAEAYNPHAFEDLARAAPDVHAALAEARLGVGYRPRD